MKRWIRQLLMVLCILGAFLLAAVVSFVNIVTFDSETSFWIYSSVAQTFAALLGLTLLLVTFRRQYLDSQVERLEGSTFDFLGATIGWSFLQWDADLEKKVEEEFPKAYFRKIMGDYADYARFVKDGEISDNDMDYIRSEGIPRRFLDTEGDDTWFFRSVVRRKEEAENECIAQRVKLKRTIRARDRIVHERDELLGNWLPPIVLMSTLLVVATTSLPWSQTFLQANPIWNSFLVIFTILSSGLSAAYLVMSLWETLGER